MLIADTVFSAVRELVDDPESEYATDERQAPLLQMAQEQLVMKMFNNPNIGRAKSWAILANVPAGTATLSAYFAAGRELELLESIDSMRERPTGTDDSSWQPMRPVNDLPIGLQTDYNGVYLPKGDDIRLPGATQALDMRIFGVFEPAVVRNKDSVLIPNTGLILKFATAALVARPHGNKDLAKDYSDQAREYTNAFMNTLIMELQDQNVRMKSFGSGLPAYWW